MNWKKRDRKKELKNRKLKIWKIKTASGFKLLVFQCFIKQNLLVFLNLFKLIFTENLLSIIS